MDWCPSGKSGGLTISWGVLEAVGEGKMTHNNTMYRRNKMMLSPASSLRAFCSRRGCSPPILLSPPPSPPSLSTPTLSLVPITKRCISVFKLPGELSLSNRACLYWFTSSILMFGVGDGGSCARNSSLCSCARSWDMGSEISRRWREEMLRTEDAGGEQYKANVNGNSTPSKS